MASKKQKDNNPQFTKERNATNGQARREQNSELYNTPCPEIAITSINGETINLRDLVGNVIIIKFSRFYKKDLSNLVYLEHLAGKYKENGISLIFVNSLGKHYSEAINKICSFFSPIIVDDGFISGLFNATPEDTVIIDRNFTIKFKSNINYIFNKSLVFKEIIKWAFEENHLSQDVSSEELTSVLNQLSFYDVIETKERQLNKIIFGKKTIFTLFTSNCTGCEENYRMRLLKEIASKINFDETQIIFLFGIGNNPEAIKQFAFVNSWNEYQIIVGVMNDLNMLRLDDYYKLFQLDKDPRTFIINKKGEVIFTENLKNSKLIDFDFLLKKK